MTVAVTAFVWLFAFLTADTYYRLSLEAGITGLQAEFRAMLAGIGLVLIAAGVVG